MNKNIIIWFVFCVPLFAMSQNVQTIWYESNNQYIFSNGIGVMSTVGDMINGTDVQEGIIIVHGIYPININNLATKTKAISQIDGLTLYPNPVDNTITLQLSESTLESLVIQIFDVHGKTVTNALWSDAQRRILDVSHLHPGFWVVKVTSASGDRMRTFTIVKK